MSWLRGASLHPLGTAPQCVAVSAGPTPLGHHGHQRSLPHLWCALRRLNGLGEDLIVSVTPGPDLVLHLVVQLTFAGDRLLASVSVPSFRSLATVVASASFCFCAQAACYVSASVVSVPCVYPKGMPS